MADRPRLKSPLDDPPAPAPPPEASPQTTTGAPELPAAQIKAWNLPSWIAVLLAPRATLRAELTRGSHQSVALLAVLSGVTSVLLVAATSRGPEPVGAWLFLAATIGSVAGFLYVYLYGALVHRSGLWLGGVAEARAARAAVAWGAMPMICLLPAHVLWMVARNSTGTNAPTIGLLHGWLTLAVGVATLMTLAACVGEAHRFSTLKGLAALWLAPLALVVLPFPAEPAARPRFSVRMLLVITTVLAVACAAYPGMTRGGGDRQFYLVFMLVAPLVVLIVLGLAHQALRRRR